MLVQEQALLLAFAALSANFFRVDAALFSFPLSFL
jgi:hypothetical protein